jgi:hypothetical protein
MQNNNQLNAIKRLYLKKENLKTGEGYKYLIRLLLSQINKKNWVVADYIDDMLCINYSTTTEENQREYMEYVNRLTNFYV